MVYNVQECTEVRTPLRPCYAGGSALQVVSEEALYWIATTQVPPKQPPQSASPTRRRYVLFFAERLYARVRCVLPLFQGSGVSLCWVQVTTVNSPSSNCCRCGDFLLRWAGAALTAHRRSSRSAICSCSSRVTSVYGSGGGAMLCPHLLVAVLTFAHSFQCQY